MILLRNTFLSLLLLLLPQLGFTQEETLELRARLAEAKAGDFLITYQNRAYTLMHIRHHEDKRMIIEEISVPERHRNTDALSWHDWVAQGAPHHTSWVAYEIELNQGGILEYYSFTKQGWADIDHNDNFLTSLLNLQLEKVPLHKRKRAGHLSHNGPDQRKLWNPKVVVNGKTIPNVSFDAWKTKWPSDGSELAGKTVEVYLPKQTGPYPSYFPYWIQVSKGALGAKFRIVDSGTGLASPKEAIPRRPPTLVDNGSLHNGHLLLRVKGRPYYSDYQLYAVDADTPDEAPVLLTFTEEKKADGILHFWVDEATQHSKLHPKCRYLFYIVPKGFEEIFARTDEPYLWSPKDYEQPK